MWTPGVCPASNQAGITDNIKEQNAFDFISAHQRDNDVLDLVEDAHLTLKGAANGEIAFGALKGFLDVRYGSRDGSACAEFSWEGHDDDHPACGRGWVMIGTAGRLVGQFYIHNGDASGFVCERD